MSSEVSVTPTQGWSSGVRRVGTGTIVLGIVAIAFVLRLWELGERPFHHDESLDAWWSWLFRNGGYEQYDPVYHGPLRFYITAGFYELFGESEAVARLFSALCGTAVVGLPWFLRRDLGRFATIASSVALCISPTMLYYSRFGREDAQMVFLTLLSMVLGLAYLRRPRTATAVGLALTLAASFAIKESTYLFGLLLAVYLLVVLAAQFDAQVTGYDEDGETMRPTFFGAALLAASVGLLLAVIVGSAADELFPMIAIYMAALAALVAATALPRIRQADLEWSFASAALALVCVGALAMVVRSHRLEPTSTWSYSTLTVIVIIGLIVLIAGLHLTPLGLSVDDRTTWTLALAGAAAALLVRESLRWRHGNTAYEVPLEWSISAVTPIIAIALFGAGVAIAKGLTLLAPASTDFPISPRASRTAGLALAAFGLALGLNEYTESEPNRVVAALVIATVIAAVIGLSAVWPRARADFVWPPLVRAIGAIGVTGWLTTLAAFAVFWWFMFTVWGSVKQDWASGFTRAIEYWDSQQEVNRGGQPWYYYLFALPAYEWFFVALGSVGAWRTLRRPTLMNGLFLWFAIGSMILYSYAGERMPWLIAHPLLPVLVLAAIGSAWLWQERNHSLMPAVGVACMVGLLLTAGTAWRSSFPNGADAREILSQAGQATPHVTTALARLDNIDRLSLQTTGEPATLAIGTANAWPWSWYLRDRPDVRWFDNETGPPTDPDIDVIIVDHSVANPADFPEFQATVFAMRSWWVPTYTEASPLAWVSWVRGRDLWPQGPNANFVGVSEVAEIEAEEGLRARLDRIQSGVDRRANGFVDYTAAGRDPVVADDGGSSDDLNDGRDGCGSVDQWFMVRLDLAIAEQQVYPDDIEAMGPLECASDLLALGAPTTD